MFCFWFLASDSFPSSPSYISLYNVLYKFKVVKLIEKRLPSKLVREYIIDQTPQKELDKLKIKNIYPTIIREKGTGRPTKKERRTLKKHKLIN